MFSAAENNYSKQHFFFDFLDFGDRIAHWYKSTYDESEGENKIKKEIITSIGLNILRQAEITRGKFAQILMSRFDSMFYSLTSFHATDCSHNKYRTRGMWMFPRGEPLPALTIIL